MKDSRLSKGRAAVAAPDLRAAVVAVASARVVAVVAVCRVAAAVAAVSAPAGAGAVERQAAVAVVSALVAAVAVECRVAAAVAAVSAPVVVAVAAVRSLAADLRAVDSFCIEELKVGRHRQVALSSFIHSRVQLQPLRLREQSTKCFERESFDSIDVLPELRVDSIIRDFIRSDVETFRRFMKVEFAKQRRDIVELRLVGRQHRRPIEHQTLRLERELYVLVFLSVVEDHEARASSDQLLDCLTNCL